MGVYIKNITKDDLAENGALMWGKRIIFIPPEDIIPVQDHGDLIDIEALRALTGMRTNCSECKHCGLFGCNGDISAAYICGVLDSMPVIIHAEGANNERAD